MFLINDSNVKRRRRVYYIHWQPSWCRRGLRRLGVGDAELHNNQPFIHPASHVRVCADPFARCGRSCASYRWSDHEHRKVKLIWCLLRVWPCIVIVNCSAFLSRCQGLWRNAAAIRRARREARPSALTVLRGRCASWWESGMCHDTAGFRAGCWSLWRVYVWITRFPHKSNRSFMINYVKSFAPRAVPSIYIGIRVWWWLSCFFFLLQRPRLM